MSKAPLSHFANGAYAPARRHAATELCVERGFARTRFEPLVAACEVDHAWPCVYGEPCRYCAALRRAAGLGDEK
jgi:hypothetical protein